MIKTIALIKRKPGISREEFVAHYEDVHAPLALKHLPMIKKYIRNHVVDIPDVEGPDFDCISEFWFDSLEEAMGVMEFVQSDEGKIFRDDEEKFMDRDETIAFMVEEKISKIKEK